MLLYRITKIKYLENFSGLGSSYKVGGRWNKAGTPVLYFALSPSLAMLEMANYTASPRMLTPSTVLGTYEIPDESPIKLFSTGHLPTDWAEFPYPVSTQALGDDWLQGNTEFGLSVPSCAVPATLERTLVVNPRHDLFTSRNVVLKEFSRDIFNPRAFIDV